MVLGIVNDLLFKVLVLGIVNTLHNYWYWVLLNPLQKLVLVLSIVKASLEILGIGIGVKKVVLLRSATDTSTTVLATMFLEISTLKMILTYQI